MYHYKSNDYILKLNFKKQEVPSQQFFILTETDDP